MGKCCICKQKDHEWFSADRDGGMPYEERELWGDALEAAFKKTHDKDFKDFLWGWMWDVTPL